MGVKEILLERREKEGEHKNAVKAALVLKTKKIPLEVIAEATGLSIKEIEALTLPVSEL